MVTMKAAIRLAIWITGALCARLEAALPLPALDFERDAANAPPSGIELTEEAKKGGATLLVVAGSAASGRHSVHMTLPPDTAIEVLGEARHAFDPKPLRGRRARLTAQVRAGVRGVFVSVGVVVRGAGGAVSSSERPCGTSTPPGRRGTSCSTCPPTRRRRM